MQEAVGHVRDCGGDYLHPGYERNKHRPTCDFERQCGTFLSAGVAKKDEANVQQSAPVPPVCVWCIVKYRKCSVRLTRGLFCASIRSKNVQHVHRSKQERMRVPVHDFRVSANDCKQLPVGGICLASHRGYRRLAVVRAQDTFEPEYVRCCSDKRVSPKIISRRRTVCARSANGPKATDTMEITAIFC